MKLKKVILELQQNIKPYLPFLTDWMVHKHCSLNKEDFLIIDFHVKNQFKFYPLQYYNPSNSCKAIQRIVAKLIWDLQRFKDWIITNFLFRLVDLIRNNNYNDLFLHLPLDYLSIEFDLKNKLRAFKIKTIYEIFEKYNEHDFYVEATFRNIIDFEVASKDINQKTECL